MIVPQSMLSHNFEHLDFPRSAYHGFGIEDNVMTIKSHDNEVSFHALMIQGFQETWQNQHGRQTKRTSHNMDPLLPVERDVVRQARPGLLNCHVS